MNKRSAQSKLTIYRRHAGKCPIESSRTLDACECPLWVHGKVRGSFIQESLDTRNLATAIVRRDGKLAGKPGDDPTPGGGIRLAGSKTQITIEEAANEFLAAKQSKGTSTVMLYTSAVKHFASFARAHGLVHLKQIETAHLRLYFKEFGSQWNATTAEGRLTHLRVWFNYATKPSRRWLDFSPAAESDLAQNDGTGVERQPFTPQQVTQILAAVEQTPADVRDRARALVLLLLYTGMRISDATFFERAYLTASHTANYYVIKTRRPITLAPTVQQPALDALAKLPASRVYFFQADRSDDYNEARTALRRRKEFSKLMPDYHARVRETTALVLKVLSIAGIDGACHRFRDTFAINMLVGDGETGADIFTVSKMLGHSDVKITDEHYLKLVPGYQERMSQSTRVLAYQFPLAG